MRKHSDESCAVKQRRLEAAEWWVELESGCLLSQEKMNAWREWSSRPENERAYEDVVQIATLLRALTRPLDGTAEELQVRDALVRELSR